MARVVQRNAPESAVSPWRRQRRGSSSYAEGKNGVQEMAMTLLAGYGVDWGAMLLRLDGKWPVWSSSGIHYANPKCRRSQSEHAGQ